MADLEPSCFLCFQTSTSNDYGTSDFEPHSLRYIFNYLKINPNVAFENRLLNKEEHAAIRVFEVLLCTTCSKVVAKLSSLIQQLELTQLLIDHQMQQLNQVLQIQVPKFANLTETEPDENAEIEKELHNMLAKKCQTLVNKLIKRLPTVRVKRVAIPAATIRQEHLSNDDETFDNFDYSNQFQDDSQDSTDGESVASSDTIKKSSFQSYNEKLLKVCKNFSNKIKSNKKVKCSICKNIWKDYANVPNHFVAVHPEKLFEHQKLTNVSLEDYMFYCKHAFRVEMSCAKRRKGEDGRLKIECPHCVISKTFEKHNDMRRHLAIEHYKIMEQKIISLQKSGNISNLAEIELPRVRPTQNKSVCKNWIRLNQTSNKLLAPVADKPNKLKCELCGNFAQAQNPRLHLVTHHPETLFENSEPPADLKPEKFRILCKNFMLVESSQKEKTAGAVKNKGISYKCHLCAQNSHNTVQFRYHLASKHFNYLEEKFTHLSQERINLLLEENILKFRGNGTLYKHEKRIVSFRDQLRNKLYKSHCFTWRRPPKCKICKGVVRYKGDVLEHFVKHHSEEVFSEMKIESVTKKQFGLCCKRLLERETEQGRDASGFKCRYCKNSEIAKENPFQVHLIAKHFGVLEEGLVRMQTEKIWNNEKETLEKRTLPGGAKRRKIKENVMVASQAFVEVEYVKTECIGNDNIDIEKEQKEIEEQDFDPSHDLERTVGGDSTVKTDNRINILKPDLLDLD